MERQFINQILAQVRKRMVSFEAEGCRQSRRVSGVFDREDEIHGFKNLCIYIDTALDGWEEIFNSSRISAGSSNSASGPKESIHRLTSNQPDVFMVRTMNPSFDLVIFWSFAQRRSSM